MEDIEEDVLAEFFSHCGEVVAVRKSGRFAWVEFATVPGMQAALSLDGEPLGNGTMKVQQSRTPIMNAGWRAPPKEPGPSGRPPSFQASLPVPPQEAIQNASYNGPYVEGDPGHGSGCGNGYPFNSTHPAGEAPTNSMAPGVGPNAVHAPPHMYSSSLPAHPPVPAAAYPTVPQPSAPGTWPMGPSQGMVDSRCPPNSSQGTGPYMTGRQ